MPASKTGNNPEARPRHSLSSVNKDALTAICAVCGPTEIRCYIRDNKYTSYLCIEGNRQRSAAYRLAHPKISRLHQRRTTSHILSNVDDDKRTATCSICGQVKIYIRRGKIFDTRVCKNAANKRSQSAAKKRREENLEFIESYKPSFGCKNCGSHDSTVKLEFHAPGKSRREDYINRLLRFKRERLILELEKFDVLCKECHRKEHRKPSGAPIGQRRKPIRKKRTRRNPPPFMYDA